MNARRSIIDTDAPEHVRLRKLGIPAFTSHRVKSYEEVTREIAAQLLRDAAEQGSVDLVQSISAPLPIRVIINILGVPEEDAAMLVQWSDELIDSTGVPADAYGNTTPLELLPFSAPASHALFEYGRKMREERTRNPKDDLTTALVEARYEGEALSDYDFKNMFHVLVFAGNETTRTAISNGIQAFADNPDQLDLLYARPELVENAVEEIIRWATPVLHMRRTATCDTELAGVPIREDDKVVIFYCSANFDEDEFAEPAALRHHPPGEAAAGLVRRQGTAPLPGRTAGPHGDPRPARGDDQAGHSASSRPARSCGRTPASSTASPRSRRVSRPTEVSTDHHERAPTAFLAGA